MAGPFSEQDVLNAAYDSTTGALKSTPSATDDAAFTPATSKVQPIGFLADETATDSVDEGDAGIARMTLDRRIHTTQAGYSFSALATAATTTVKSGAGQLHMILVTGGTAGTIVVYDNTAGSGTQIANFDSTNAIATYGFNISFATGLTIVAAANTKFTVIYK